MADARQPFVVRANTTALAELLLAEAAHLFFAGLLETLPHCTASGEMDAWEECARSVVTLLASKARAALSHEEKRG